MVSKRVKKRENFLAEQYFKSFSYLNESKNFIFSIVLVFLFFVMIGFIVPVPDEIRTQIFNYLQELIEKTENFDSAGDWIGFLLLNNLLSSFLGMIFGFLLGVYPLIGAIANGYIVGFVSYLSVSEGGILSLWRLFPHGIFELPALFISLGLGLKFGTFLFQREKGKSFVNYLINSLRVFVFVVLPLLIVAAIIEGYLIFLSV